MPVKTKDGKSGCDPFTSVLRSADPRKPERPYTDKGNEFFNRNVTSLMTQNGIHHFASQSDMKVAVVKRLYRKLKTQK